MRLIDNIASKVSEVQAELDIMGMVKRELQYKRNVPLEVYYLYHTYRANNLFEALGLGEMKFTFLKKTLDMVGAEKAED